jgi:galactokinase
MPCAISKGTWLAIGRNKDKRLRFQSLDFPGQADLHLQTSYTKTGKEWFNYPLGVINEFLENGKVISGLDMLFYGDLPIGAGLSSSASVEVLTAYAMEQVFQWNISKKDLAILSQKVENRFIGVNCGIMDQFAVAMGEPGKAILLDCETLEYTYLPVDTGDFVLVIINSNKKRALTESKYNERFVECQEALQILRQELPVNNLCEISPETFMDHRYLLNNEILERRALHVIEENERVKQAATALKTGDLEAFGRLMYDSHRSLRDLYEVSGKELDTIVAFCSGFTGCIGARMTGAGFGGCAIALVHKNKVDDFSARLINDYREKTGYVPSVIISGIGAGVQELRF